jgi:hypothetical protein
MVAVSVEALVDAPAPRVGLTVTSLGVGDSVVSVWRAADGEREPVRGARRTTLNDAAFLVDWDAPLGRPITYEVEVISGPSGAARVTAAPVTVESETGWLMDPLVPQSAVPIVHPYGADGQPVLASKALASLEYAAEVSVFNIMGSNKPLALFGQRMAAAGVDFSMITDAAEENARLRKLFMSTASLLVRLPASWGAPVEGSCFVSAPGVSESPLDAGSGGRLTAWEFTGNTVQAPTIKVLTATFSYGDVQILMDTYGQKQDLMAGKSYLDDLKNPIGG